MNIFFETIGVVAGLLIAIASLPQLVQTHKTRNVNGLSFNTFLIWATAALCWAIYGGYLGSYQMIIFNGFSFVSSLYIMYMIKKYSK